MIVFAFKVMRFETFYGRGQTSQINMPKFYPVATKVKGTLDYFRSTNAEELFARFQQQLPELAATNGLLRSLDISVRFGRFYIMDQSCSLQNAARWVALLSILPLPSCPGLFHGSDVDLA